jgi:mono/diheme cytochrome c family protein
MLLQHPNRRFFVRTCIWILFLSGLALQAQDKVIKRVSADPTPTVSGREIFHAYCATCHGADAKGGGPAAAALKTTPADLTQLARRHNGKFPNSAVAETLRNGGQPAHGSAEMPIWGPVLQSVSDNPREVELRINNVVAYLASIQVR